jgi:hypothetical protein
MTLIISTRHTRLGPHAFSSFREIASLRLISWWRTGTRALRLGRKMQPRACNMTQLVLSEHGHCKSTGLQRPSCLAFSKALFEMNKNPTYSAPPLDSLSAKSSHRSVCTAVVSSWLDNACCMIPASCQTVPRPVSSVTSGGLCLSALSQTSDVPEDAGGQVCRCKP